jgi:hypothetical protein
MKFVYVTQNSHSLGLGRELGSLMAENDGLDVDKESYPGLTGCDTQQGLADPWSHSLWKMTALF